MTPAATCMKDRAATVPAGEVDAVAAVAAVTARLVNASADLERRQATEKRERMQRYRAAVEKAADNEGSLAETEIEQLMADCLALGFHGDAFSEDLGAVWRDREREQRITALRERGSEASKRRAVAAAEEAEASGKFAAAREELENLVARYDRELAVIRRRIQAAGIETDAAAREAGKIESKQTYERSLSPRVWGSVGIK
jgi:hypothetical protein